MKAHVAVDQTVESVCPDPLQLVVEDDSTVGQIPPVDPAEPLQLVLPRGACEIGLEVGGLGFVSWSCLTVVKGWSRVSLASDWCGTHTLIGVDPCRPCRCSRVHASTLCPRGATGRSSRTSQSWPDHHEEYCDDNDGKDGYAGWSNRWLLARLDLESSALPPRLAKLLAVREIGRGFVHREFF